MMEEESSAALAQPWGRAVGLFAGCAITVVGALRSVAPGELLLRVLIGSLLTGMIVRVFLEVLRLASARPEEED